MPAAPSTLRGGRTAPAPSLGVAAPRRPEGCPPVVQVELAVGQLEAFFAVVNDSDSRGGALDRFNARVGAGCLSRPQAERVLALSSELQGQAKGEQKSLDRIASGFGVGDLVGALLNPETWIRVAEVVGGAIMVYVGARMILNELGGPALPKITSAIPQLGAIRAVTGRAI